MTNQNKAPVTVSGEAYAALAEKIREWSGWPDARLTLGKPPGLSPWAITDHNTREFIVNVDELSLNPNRVILSVNPFRLRQEAVLTGTMLHEAAHARYSTWQPRNAEQRAALRVNNQPVSDLALNFAKVVEEARVEGLMAGNSGVHGAAGLGWTMRAAAAHLLPMTRLHLDPGQKMMDLLTSWVLRAGRQYAYRGLPLNAWAGEALPRWVVAYTELLSAEMENHIQSVHDNADRTKVLRLRDAVLNHLTSMLTADGGPNYVSAVMLGKATDIMEILFPEDKFPPESQPTVSGACGSSSEGGDEVSGNPDSGEEDGESEGEAPGQPDPTQQALDQIEQSAQAQGQAEAKEEAKKAPPVPGGTGAGEDSGTPGNAGFRAPTKDERDVQKGAESFLRGLIEPSETSKVILSESPSATVDGAALAAWKAGGQVRDPQFFRRTRRDVEPSPPVKIAVLVDISGSMEVLQDPSALLSWALSSAALDLRNFAGRGTQMESCLIHWGDRVEVIQKNGEPLPGIRTAPCNQGTSAMHRALEEVEKQITGFFDPAENGKPSNRLLVQFTDWELNRRCSAATKPIIHKAIENGVNMLTVAPAGYRDSSGSLSSILSGAKGPGTSKVIKYRQGQPGEVWTHAAEMLG